MADGFAPAKDASPPIALGHRARSKVPLVIGLVNNMPDAAVAATEEQFRALIEHAAGERPVVLKLFSLPGVPRGEVARAAMRPRYASTRPLFETSVDALIVTGAEPVAADLRDEPFWPDMAVLTDWAQANTVSTIFSCLAAPAAVLHLDGVRRQPLAEKCSGVFEMQGAAHPLTSGHLQPVKTPHSRWNTLDEASLTEGGYTVLTRSAEIGVDAFVRDRNSLFLFLQGHPEYAAETLMLEYRRDLRRFLIGERPTHPAVPAGYFDSDVERALRALAAETARRPALAALSECGKILNGARPAARWAPTTRQLYANWLDLIAARVEVRVRA